MKFLILLVCIIVFKNSIEIEETTTELCGNSTEDICEAFTSVDLSTETEPSEVTSEGEKAAVTTKKPKTTTTKSVGKKNSLRPNVTTPPHPHPNCNCDMIQGGCEINCCCDVDCSSEQRAVFTQCLSTPQLVDTDHCFPPHLLHHNNTDLLAVEADPGVLCVARQNNLANTDFVDIPVIQSVITLEKKLEKHKYYSWPNSKISPPVFDIDSFYGNDSPIWITDNSTIGPLVFPAPVGHSMMCRGTVTPQYLGELKSICTRRISKKTDCLDSLDNQFSIISSPHNYNFTHPQECPDDICLPVQKYICSKNCTKASKIPSTTFNDLLSLCLNVIHSVEYKVYHNGSQGISHVEAFYTLKNVTVSDNQVVRKSFTISYTWAGITDHLLLRRSGRPGYKHGKPIISGRKINKAPYIQFNTSLDDWISIGMSGRSGYCHGRQNLLFGQNVFSRCLVKVNGSCSQIQQQIWQQILAPEKNLSEVVISSFGDPDGTNKDRWVPLLMPESPPPPVLTSAVNLIIVYSMVGAVASPQTKVIGAYVSLQPSGLTCDSNSSVVMVETSVKFIDKTLPAITTFAQPPVYEIKLPQDFFYPFFSNGSKNSFVSLLVLIELFVILLF